MSDHYECPHCGKPVILDVKKAVLQKAQPMMSQPAEKELEEGVFETFEKALDRKVATPLASLARFQQQAQGDFGKGNLGKGWLTGARNLMQRREEMLKKGYLPPKQGEESSGDDKAARVQALIMKGLGGGGK